MAKLGSGLGHKVSGRGQLIPSRICVLRWRLGQKSLYISTPGPTFVAKGSGLPLPSGVEGEVGKQQERKVGVETSIS